MVAHVYNPSTREAKVEDLECEAILGYIVRHCFKRKRKAQHWWLMPVILATWETEIRRIFVQGQPGQKIS
jgi:hypothetical protein